MVPHIFTSFDLTRHLPRGDIMFSHDMAIVLVKWSKTMQARDKISRIRIPVLPGSKLCPMAALKRMLAIVPGSRDDPLFSICRQGQWLPLTDSIVRKHLKRVTCILSWQHLHMTFYTFRRAIFTHIIIHFLILLCKLFDYTYPIDGCLGEFYVLLSCLLINS